ncbi:MAG TPA: hypothetical protein ENK43_01215 [Planctomycetes bacterium]|nr:hypothetical protein [Planctomycetota bacterium]
MTARRGPSNPLWIYPATLGLLFLRRPDQFFHPQFQAEDGGLFFMQARESGLAAIGRTYNGYHHLLPRLTAALADAVVSPRWTPHVYALVSALAVLVVVGMAVSPRIHLPGKPLIALAPLLIPHNGWVYLHLTDVQSVLAWGLILLLIAEPPTRRRERVFDLLYIVLAGLTGPFVLFFLPLFLGRWLSRRDAHGLLLLLLALGCAGLQAKDLPEARIQRPGQQFDIRDPSWVRVIGARYAGIGLFGQQLGRKIAEDPRAAWALLAATAVLLLGTTYLLLTPLAPRLLTIHLAGLAVFLATLWAYRFRPILLFGLIADRYAFLPMTALLAALLGARRAGGRRSRLAGLLLLFLIPGTAATFRSEPLVDDGWPSASRVFGGNLPADVIVHPYWVLPYRPEHEGRKVSPNLFSDIVSASLRLMPVRVAPPIEQPILTEYFGGGFLRTPADTVIEFEIPRGARGFRVQTGLLFRGGTPNMKDGFDFLVERSAPGSQEFHVVRSIRHQPGPDALLGVFPRPHVLEAPLDGTPGRLRLRAAAIAGTTGSWWVLWGAAVFR